MAAEIDLGMVPGMFDRPVGEVPVAHPEPGHSRFVTKFVDGFSDWFRPEEAEQTVESAGPYGRLSLTSETIDGKNILIDEAGRRYVDMESEVIMDSNREDTPVPIAEENVAPQPSEPVASAIELAPSTPVVMDEPTPMETTGFINIGWNSKGKYEVSAAGSGDTFKRRLSGAVDNLDGEGAVRRPDVPIGLLVEQAVSRQITQRAVPQLVGVPVETSDAMPISGEAGLRPRQIQDASFEVSSDNDAKERLMNMMRSRTARKVGKLALIGGVSVVGLHKVYEAGYQFGQENGLLGPVGWLFGRFF